MNVQQLALTAIAATATFGPLQCAISCANTEEQAIVQAREAFVDLLRSSDASIRWADSLKTLAQSKSPAADSYLVELGLFKLDGEAGSEYSCAASIRGQRFSQLMRKQLAKFDRDNACRRLAATRGLDAQRLCATKEEFRREVKAFRNVPLPDLEGACSYR